MNEILILLLSFLAAEAVFLVVLFWTYRQLNELHAFRHNASARLLTKIVFILLPVLLAVFLLPGLIQRLEVARLASPQTGLATPIAFGISTPSLPPVKTPRATTTGTARMAARTAALASQTPAPTVLSKTAAPGALPTATQRLLEGVVLTTTTVATDVVATPVATGVATVMVTDTAQISSQESLSGKIVYTCQLFYDSFRDQICLIYADGTGYRRLTALDRVDHNFPTLSPDGEAVLYASNEKGAFEIYEMNLESGTVTQLTNGLGDSIAPDVSPDGSLVVFTVRKDERQGIWVMDRSGGNPHQVYGPPEADGWDPVWSPDGSKILFTSNAPGQPQLVNIQPDGSGFEQITQMQGILGGNSWSPDGLKIATYLGESWNREIYIMAPDGTNLRQVTSGGNNLSPSFSPDGNWIAFTSYRDLYGDEDGCEIYVMSLDGSQLRRLTNNNTCDWQPNWGP